ncbi:olfactory receptor 1D2-like [Myripristis murdjan]|uniref:Olfactory receptor 1D2-like n=1 Tax=Myripristis murdjan TaxID=586833 RepID=A0A667Z8Y3_9TELE|nr:olfactory receptor 1D2-like [Myripristis murdjan]
MDNVSVTSLFTLLGLNCTVEQKVTLFSLTLLCYLIIWILNIVLIITIIVDKGLHEPMYIFLCNLCINGLYGTSGFYPKFLMDLLSPSHVISYAGCLLQSFVIHSSTGCDLSVLAVMAYDRYVAICRPLVYHSVMTKQRVSLLVFFSWLLPLYCMFMNTITISQSKLCGSHIHKLYCSNWLIGKIACSATTANSAVVYFNIAFYASHSFFIAWSYMYLIRMCIKPQTNRSKFMQTCVPHLLSLFTYSFAVILELMYMRFGPRDVSQSLQNFMAIQFLIFPPILNPLIYGLKLTKIRNRILGVIHDRGKDQKCVDKAAEKR